MKLTLKKIEALKPCADGLQWYKDHGTSDLEETLLTVNETRPEWARWLFSRLMTRKQRLQIAIFSAEQVLDPENLTARNAINAAKAVLKRDTIANRQRAKDAAYAAADAAYAAAAANAAYAAAYAASAASAADADAADAADAAADAAYAADAAKHEMQERIIRQAVKVLSRRKAKKGTAK